MTVAVVLNDEKHANQVLPWAVRFANAKQSDLLAIVVKRSKGDGKWQDIDWANPSGSTELAIQKQLVPLSLVLSSGITGAQQPSSDRGGKNPEAENVETIQASEVSFVARRFQALDPVAALSDEIAGMKIDLLIVPKSIDSRTESDSADWHDKLYRQAPCRTMFLHDDVLRASEKLKILAVVKGDTDDRAALLTSYELAKSSGGEATAMFFEPAIDDWAMQVGDRILNKIVTTELGHQHDQIRQRTVLANGAIEGLKKLAHDEYDIIIFGSRQRREIQQIMNAVSGSPTGDAPAVAAVRNRVPLSNRWASQFQEIVQRYVPQLTRDQRISLFEKVQTSSQWDFDFIALICLSTLIAALGLIDNSIPVVIGAMLVAPLMTPIVAIGLGLAQANLYLITSSTKTVARGFATAFFIGVLAGLCMFSFSSDPTATPEMSSRNMPGFIDLLVALVSGIAAAYALGRPNLTSAIPGVAIAAALVPPLATAGLATSLLDIDLAVGATLLFLTNMVAIVLAAGVVFWSVGVRTAKQNQDVAQWPRWLMLGLIVLTILLTAGLELYHHPHWWRS